MSILARILGRRPAPTVQPPPASPPPGDLLSLTGPGLAGADLSGEIELTITVPFSDEILAALLRREDPKGELLSTVVSYEQGEFPAADGEVSLAGAYDESLTWAGEAVRSVEISRAPSPVRRGR